MADMITRDRTPDEIQRVWVPVDAGSIRPDAPFPWAGQDEPEPEPARERNDEETAEEQAAFDTLDSEAVVQQAVRDVVKCAADGKAPQFGDDVYEAFHQLGMVAPRTVFRALSQMQQALSNQRSAAWWWADFRAAVIPSRSSKGHKGQDGPDVLPHVAALAIVWKWATENKDKLYRPGHKRPSGAVAGRWDDKFLALTSGVLRDVIHTAGYDLSLVRREWRNSGWLTIGSGQGYQRYITIAPRNEREHCYCIRTDAIKKALGV